MVEQLPEARVTMAFDRQGENNHPERYINQFVILQTVVLMAIRGLGVLAFAWSTVVLLGGFVTLLEKDFWCITVLILLQTARIFDALADEQYQYFVDLLFDPILQFIKQHTTTKTQQVKENSNEMTTDFPNQEKNRVSRTTHCDPCPCFSKKDVLGYKLTFVLLLVPLIIVVFHPVLVVLLSISLSSTRLKQEDFGKGGANLMPAMVIFYSLALAQGVLYLFWLVLTVLEHQMVKLVAREYEIESSWGHNYVSRYLTETRSRCLKDLSSIKERNMINHASDLIDSDYEKDYISGATMLVTFIQKKKLPEKARIHFSRSRTQKLILILAWRDQDNKGIRLLAAKIVAHIAGDISLAQFPGTLDCLSSLLVSEENPIFTSLVESKNMDKTRDYPNKNDVEYGTWMEKDEIHNISDYPNKNDMECGTWMEKEEIHSGERRLVQNSDKIRKGGQKNLTAKDDIDRQQYRITEEHFSQPDECQLVIQGFLILEKLCSDDHNCIEICNAQL